MKSALSQLYANLISPLQALKTSQQSVKGIRWWILGLLVIAMINSLFDQVLASQSANEIESRR